MIQELRRRIAIGLFFALWLTAPLRAAGVAVSISPDAAYVVAGHDRQFTAQASGAVNPGVTWSVNGIPNGNSAVGTVSGSGKYVASASAAAGAQFIVQAASVEDPGAFGAANVSIVNSSASLSSLSPASLASGPFTLSVFGANFVNGATVNWNGTPLTTTFVSKSYLKASGNAAAGTVNITVQNPLSLPSQILTLTVTASGVPAGPLPPVGPISVSVSPAIAGMPLGGSQQFLATVNNSANQAVVWKVNGSAGGDAGSGLITASGLYTAPGIMPSPNVVAITAVAAANGVAAGTATVTIQNPSAITWGRFLDQAAFGPTPALMAHAQQIGVDAFIDEQFGLPESALPAESSSRNAVMDAFWGNARNGPDQLRQRVLYALSEIIVISLNKNVNGDMVIPWLKILSRDAFGNYKQLLKDITLDGGMGQYLDLVNSGGSGAPNENYPREAMQLFSIGLVQLNQDGSVKLDGGGHPIPTYTQADVVGLAKALTGWTWNSPTGTVGGGGNNSYYPGPMLPMPSRHAAGAKTFLGQTLPAGQSIQQDLDGAIDIIFSHPNVAPFVATRLIRALVTSNPSPAYIAAVAAVFDNNGSGVKGDMKAVIKAILENPDARNDNTPGNFGRLRTPEQYLITISREMNLGLNAASNFNYLLENMNEGVLDAPSVFGHYSPLFRIPGGGLFGPEFQIYSASDAVNRANFLYQMLNVYPFNPAISPFINIAGNAQALIDAVDNTLLFGRMSPALRNAIFNSLSAMPDNNQRAINAIYLAATSGEYMVQR